VLHLFLLNRVEQNNNLLRIHLKLAGTVPSIFIKRSGTKSSEFKALKEQHADSGLPLRALSNKALCCRD